LFLCIKSAISYYSVYYRLNLCCNCRFIVLYFFRFPELNVVVRSVFFTFSFCCIINYKWSLYSVIKCLVLSYHHTVQYVDHCSREAGPRSLYVGEYCEPYTSSGPTSCQMSKFGIGNWLCCGDWTRLRTSSWPMP